MPQGVSKLESVWEQHTRSSRQHLEDVQQLVHLSFMQDVDDILHVLASWQEDVVDAT